MKLLFTFITALFLKVAFTTTSNYNVEYNIIHPIFTERSFGISYDQNTFLKDGEPFRYISGSIHYFRVPHEYWIDRLTKLKAAGLNTVQTYIEWSSHEPEQNVYYFNDNLDLVKYIKTAQELGLYVILRPGPYIDSERDFGGLPYWLLSNKDVRLRTMDPKYMNYVERWYAKLLPLIKPLLYVNGGPVLMLQVENEYGSYFECDRDYTAKLAYIMREALGTNTLLFTTDGNTVSFLKCGYTDGVYPTIDFGPGSDVNASFAALRTKEITGPLVNSEYYPGWIDHWNYPHSHTDDSLVAETLDEMLAINASVNIYLFHGGTSFGFKSGSNYDGKQFFSCPTSYDFDAPISEAGDLTSKYYALQNVIKKYVPVPESNIPAVANKMKFGPVPMTPYYPLLSYMKMYVPSNYSDYPLTFEELEQDYGFVGYQTTLNIACSDPSNLTIAGIRDRGYVYIDNHLTAILSREEKIYSTYIIIRPNQTLTIIVENQGRIDYGPYLNDPKGILGNVTLDDKILGNWTMYPFKNRQYFQGTKKYTNTRVKTSEPGFYSSEFVLPNDTKPADTFLRLDGWNKGVAFLNNYNLGRYWPIAGPQVTLYVPGVWFKPAPAINTLFLLELEHAPCSLDESACSIGFVDVHVINGTTPNKTTLKHIKI